VPTIAQLIEGYAVGTSIAVQQKLMRHADIRTTMNVRRGDGSDGKGSLEGRSHGPCARELISE